jgi:outer membrane immunogenic protein
MSRLLIVAIAALLLGGPQAARAADMPLKAPKAPSAATAYDWTGFYIGGNGGYAWGLGTDPAISYSDTSGTGYAAYVASGGFPTPSIKPEGGFGGGQIGYNWQIKNWLLGIEADIEGGEISASASRTLSPAVGAVVGTSTVDHSLKWFGTVRGRMGYAANNWLLYGTGGLIYGRVKSTLTQSSPANGYFATNTVSSTKTGWTAGGGIEWGFAGHWTAKLEYLYYDLGRDSVTVRGVGVFTGIVYTAEQQTAGQLLRAGLSYRF